MQRESRRERERVEGWRGRERGSERESERDNESASDSNNVSHDRPDPPPRFAILPSVCGCHSHSLTKGRERDKESVFVGPEKESVFVGPSFCHSKSMLTRIWQFPPFICYKMKYYIKFVSALDLSCKRRCRDSTNEEMLREQRLTLQTRDTLRTKSVRLQSRS